MMNNTHYELVNITHSEVMNNKHYEVMNNTYYEVHQCTIFFSRPLILTSCSEFCSLTVSIYILR